MLFPQAWGEVSGVRDGRSIRPQQDKSDTLKRSSLPIDESELRSVIGKLNLYARFIENYLRKLEPSNLPLTKAKDFQWTAGH